MPVRPATLNAHHGVRRGRPAACRRRPPAGRPGRRRAPAEVEPAFRRAQRRRRSGAAASRALDMHCPGRPTTTCGRRLAAPPGVPATPASRGWRRLLLPGTIDPRTRAAARVSATVRGAGSPRARAAPTGPRRRSDRVDPCTRPSVAASARCTTGPPWQAERSIPMGADLSTPGPGARAELADLAAAQPSSTPGRRPAAARTRRAWQVRGTTTRATPMRCACARAAASTRSWLTRPDVVTAARGRRRRLAHGTTCAWSSAGRRCRRVRRARARAAAG